MELLVIKNELVEICKNILEQYKNSSQWDLEESDDCFQTENFTGGWDATEQAFCFSYYENDNEYWFQVNLSQVEQIANAVLTEIKAKKVT